MIYLPQVSYAAPEPDPPAPRQGVCLLYGQSKLPDVERLACNWYYDYGCTQSLLTDRRYVPISWSGRYTLAGLTPDYAGYLLALNEPDNAGQANVDPVEAAIRVRELAQVYPLAKLVVGGVSYFGGVWLARFVEQLGSYRPAGWHVHGYCEWGAKAEDVLNWFSTARQICPGGEFWVTEFADVDGGGNAKDLLRMVREASWITRYAWFANRIQGAEWFIPAHWSNPALIDNAGALTQFGEMYAEGV